MAEPRLGLLEPLNPGGVSQDTPSVPGLYETTLRALGILRRNCTDPLACKRLGVVAAHLERLDLSRALREMDRVWRHIDPDALPAIAPIYGRLLCLEGRDHAATLAMLRRASLAAPDPEISALTAWTLECNGQHHEACEHIGAALSSFCSPQGGLLARVASLIDGESLRSDGLRYPPDFAVDGRASLQGRKVTGWARLGWNPAHRPQLRLIDESGTQQTVQSASHPQNGYRWPFTFDLHAMRVTGRRLEISVALPGGGWQPLPDTPLLVERAVYRCGHWTDCVAHGHKARRASVQPRHPVDIIVPIFRGREETLACIDSVRRTVGDGVGFILVDDATDEPELARDLDGLAHRSGITLLRNTSNRGFVHSVNRALALNTGHDAIILNSDTVVFGDWVERLRSAAYSHPRVGTVIPLTNSGSIASYPSVTGSDMSIETAARMHELAALAHDGARPEIPVGVGFCLYIRRDCLRDIGTLDEATFGKGYGEETDFCLRARRRGWSHLLAADVFVYHSGGLSFGSRRAALLERSQRILNSRYPGYDTLIADFVSSDPLAPTRRSLDERRLLWLHPRVVLVVTLALTGGVDRFVDERCKSLQGQGILPLLLRPAAPGDRQRCELSAPNNAFPNLGYDIPTELPRLRDLLRALPIERVEIQHFLHLDARVIETVRELSAPYDIFIHDYTWICPRVTLTDGNGRYCGEPAVKTCERCIKRNGSALKETLSVASLRARSRRWISQAHEVFVPSSDTASRIRKYVDRSTITVRPNSSPSVSHRPCVATRQRDVIRIGLIGAIGTHKGYRRLLECARDAKKRNLPLEFVVIGYTENDAPLLATGRVFVTGRYGEGEAAHLLRREDPDVAWFPSVWPETWCYTLDEALNAALPIVSFDIGAMAERLRHLKNATLLPLSIESRKINDCLMRVGNPTTSEAVMIERQQPNERIVNDNSYSRPQSHTSDAELTAAVQILPLPSGLYLFSVKAAAPNVAATTGALSLPAVHVGLGPGAPTDSVEFVAGPSTHGGWLFAKGDLLVTKVKGNGTTLVLTSMRAPGGDALSIKIERLEARADATPTTDTGHDSAVNDSDRGGTTRQLARQRKPGTADAELLPLKIGAHIRTRGDMMFSDVPWAGRVAPGLWIESFSIKPLERFAAQDIEYKALTGTGFETPWLSDEKMCGTKGMSTPLLGFAIRLKPSSLAAAYDCEYTGYFQSGHTVGPLRNGVPCRSSVASDPLEGIQVRLVKRSATMLPTADLTKKRALRKATPSLSRRGSA